MEHIDDQDEIETSLAALEKIKEWADEQRVKLRRPGGDTPTQNDRLQNREGSPQAGDSLEEMDGKLDPDGAGIGPGELLGETQDDEPDEDDQLTTLSISRPGDRAPKKPPMTDPEADPDDELAALKGKFGNKQPVPKRR